MATATRNKRADAALAQLQDYLDDGGMSVPVSSGTASALLDADEDAQLDLSRYDADPDETRLSPQRLNNLATPPAGAASGSTGPAPVIGVTGGNSPAVGTAATAGPTPQRAQALRAGVVPGQREAERAAARAAKAQEQAARAEQTRQQQVADAVVTAAQTGVNSASDAVGYVHDRVSNAPAPPPGSIWILVAAVILLILLIYPVNGLPRIAWLWLVLTRHATLAGTDVSGVQAIVKDEVAAAQTILGALTGVAGTFGLGGGPESAPDPAAALATAAGSIDATQAWADDLGYRIERYTL